MPYGKIRGTKMGTREDFQEDVKRKRRIGLNLLLALRAKKSGKIRRNRSRNNDKVKLKKEIENE
jgi:hypothetical protein